MCKTMQCMPVCVVNLWSASYKFMCVTMADPAKNVLELEEIPTVVSMDKKVPPT